MRLTYVKLVFATLAAFIYLPSQAEIDEALLGKTRSYPAAPSLAQAGSNEFIVWSNSGGYESLMPFKTIKPGTPTRLSSSEKPIPVSYEFSGKTCWRARPNCFEGHEAFIATTVSPDDKFIAASLCKRWCRWV